jgi:hypothetical protein
LKNCLKLRQLKKIRNAKFAKKPPASGNADGCEILTIKKNLAPVALNPDAPAAASIPSAMHPDGIRMRTRSPMSGGPNPTPAPFPTAADPDESRVGRHRDDFNLRRRVFDDDRAGRGGLLHDDNAARLAFDNAAREQGHAGNDYNTFD